MRTPWILSTAISSLLLAACTPRVDHGERTPLAEADGTVLYADELARVMPVGLTGADSAAFADDYLRHWIENTLLAHKAEQNIPDDGLIERRVAAYRQALIVNSYQQQLLEQKLSAEVSDEEMQAFYDQHPDLFVLEEPAIKGIFIKVPRTANGLANLRKWYSHNDDASLEKIEKYSFANAVVYEYFYDHWVPLSTLIGKLPIDSSTLLAHLDKNGNYEDEDDSYCYLLHVESTTPMGHTKPFDLAKPQISSLIVNYRQVEFMNRVKEDLYNQARESGKAKYYIDNDNE